MPLIVDAVRRDVGNAAVSRSFAAQGLNPGHVYKRGAVLPLRDMVGLFERFARERADPMFGLFAAQAIRPETFGLFITYAMQAPDLRTAIDRIRRGTRLHQGGTRFTLSPRRDVVTWSYKVDLPLTIGRDHHGIHVMWQLKEFLTAFLGYQPRLIEIGVEVSGYGPPGALEAAFEAPVRWSRSAYSISFPSAVLDQPGQGSTWNGAPVSYMDLIRYVRSRPPLNDVEKTKAALGLCLEHGNTSIEAVARYLNVGVRTLQRRLMVEGVAYREILEAVRRGRADELLGEAKLPLGRVAVLLGYSDPSHFTRAYRRWHGFPPNQRRHVRGNA